MAGGEYLYNLGLAFEATAARFPDHIAIRFTDDATISYRALNAQANRLARLLAGYGVGRHDVVAIFQDKTREGFAAMLACLKLGAIYTNLDDQNPPERLRKMLFACRPRVVLCDQPPAAAVADVASNAGAVLVDVSSPDARAQLAELDTANLPSTAAVTGSDPAYIMFTSGSTGTPKGALIGHGGVLNLMRWSVSRFQITPADVLTNVNPIYFDNSVFDFYSALFSGAALAPVPREGLKNPQELVRLVERQSCTLWFSVPSLLIYLMTVKALSPAALPAMRTVVFGGEGYPKSELKKLFDLFGNRMRLVNVYGPTECTCICSAYDIGERDFEDIHGLPPLGEICPNFDFLILDGDDRSVSAGESGELCLLGPNVGLGYYNDPARTDASFRPTPRSAGYAEKMYRSGDLVRRNSSTGYLEFVGRKDNQIKHQGYRIELEEIEAALGRLDYVIQCAVIYRRVRAEFGQIEAFLAARGAPDEATVREDLRRFLPDYMVPRRITVMDELPKNANGKVDRRALLSPPSEH